jgi:ATP-dependent Clp protease ATP-binding subunit ClpC
MNRAKRHLSPHSPDDLSKILHQLTREQIEQIVTLELDKGHSRSRGPGDGAQVTDAAEALLAKKGWDPQFGARLRRVIQRAVEDELAEEMLKGVFGSDHILADVDPDDPEKLKYSKIPSVEPPAAPPTEAAVT